MARLQRIIVDLYISSDEFLKYYQGSAQAVNCRARDGRRVQFPAKLLQPFLLHDGIRGSFQISFDAQGKFASIDRLR